MVRVQSMRFPRDVGEAIYEIRERGETGRIVLHIKDGAVFGKYQKEVHSHTPQEDHITIIPSQEQGIALASGVFDPSPDIEKKFSDFVDSGKSGNFIIHFQNGQLTHYEIMPPRESPKKRRKKKRDV